MRRTSAARHWPVRCIAVALAAVATSLVASAGGPAPVAEAAPPGFVDVAVMGADRPTAVEALPGNRLVVTEQVSGRVLVRDTVTGGVTVAADLAVCATSGERGLLGFTHDPGFLRNGRVYAFYTRFAGSTCVNRVSAFTMVGNRIDPASEVVLIDNISSRNGNHNGGDIEIGNDGFLYVATGDAGSDPRGDSGSAGANDAARDLTILNGKILRLDRITGAPAPGNPLTGPGTVRCGSRGVAATTTRCQEIFAWGLRNPYRFAFDPNTSATRFFINDVGQGTAEEVNLGAIGADYGWNLREGSCPRGQTPPCAGPPAGLTDPITSYGRTTGTFITAGAFVPDGVWPAAYDGGYLFVDGGTGRMWLRDRSGRVDYGSPFSTVAAGVADMAFVMEPTGYALYYSLNFGNSVRKISFTTPPQTTTGPLAYVPLDGPERAVDTRESSPPAPIRGGQTRLLDLGAGGTPVPAGARAALVNITVDRPQGGWFATAWQPRTTRPTASNINAIDAEIVANSSIVPIVDGEMLLYVHSTSDVIVDVSGYFVDASSPVAAGRFVPVPPDRLIDMREPVGADNDFRQTLAVGAPTPDGPSRTRRFNVPVAGRLGVPESGTSAVAVVVTALSNGSAPAGWVQVTPSDRTAETSNLNTDAGFDQRNNLVVVPLGRDGSIDVDLFKTDQVLVDVVGWFTDGSQPAARSGRFRLTAPTREVDTRIPLGLTPFGRTDARSLDPGSVPGDAIAVAQNLTVAPASTLSFVSAYPGTARPEVSNLNSTANGQLRSATAFTALQQGRETLYSHYATQLVVDVVGWFEGSTN